MAQRGKSLPMIVHRAAVHFLPRRLALWCRRVVRRHRGARHWLHLCLYRLFRYNDNERASCVYWLHCRVGLDWIAQLYGRHRQSSVSMQSRLLPVQLRW